MLCLIPGGRSTDCRERNTSSSCGERNHSRHQGWPAPGTGLEEEEEKVEEGSEEEERRSNRDHWKQAEEVEREEEVVDRGGTPGRGCVEPTELPACHAPRGVQSPADARPSLGTADESQPRAGFSSCRSARHQQPGPSGCDPSFEPE